MTLLTVGEVAKITKLRPATIYAMISRQDIPVYRLGKKILRLDLDELQQWLKTQRTCVVTSNAVPIKKDSI